MMKMIDLTEQAFSKILRSLPKVLESLRNTIKTISKEVAATGKEVTEAAIRDHALYKQLYGQSFDMAMRQALRNSGQPELVALAEKSLPEILSAKNTNAEVKKVLDITSVSLNQEMNAEIRKGLKSQLDLQIGDPNNNITGQTEKLFNTGRDDAAKAAANPGDVGLQKISTESGAAYLRNVQLEQELQKAINDIKGGRILQETLDSIEQMLNIATDVPIDNATKSWFNIHNIFTRGGKIFNVDKNSIRKTPIKKLLIATASTGAIVEIYKFLKKTGKIALIAGAGYLIWKYLVGGIVKNHLAGSGATGDESVGGDVVDENGNSWTAKRIQEAVSKYEQTQQGGASTETPDNKTYLEGLVSKGVGVRGTANDGRPYVYLAKTINNIPGGTQELDDAGGVALFEDGTYIVKNTKATGRWRSSTLQESKLYDIAVEIINEQHKIK